MRRISIPLKRALDAWERSGRVASVHKKRATGEITVTLNGFQRFTNEKAALDYMRPVLGKDEREGNPARSVHTMKWDRCVKDVKAKGTAASPYAVCTSMLGERASVKAGHRRRNPAASEKLPKRVRELASAIGANVHRTPDGYYFVWRGADRSRARRAYSEGTALKLLRELPSGVAESGSDAENDSNAAAARAAPG